MKPNKALQELTANSPEAVEMYEALSRPVQRFLNEWAKLEPQERTEVMGELMKREEHGRNALKQQLN